MHSQLPKQSSVEASSGVMDPPTHGYGGGPGVSAMPVERTIHLAALAAALVWLLFWYRDTVASLLEIWGRSDTYAHGYIIAPISLWLIWRMRDSLRDIPLAPSLFGLLACGIAGFTWLLGEIASVASVSQFALVGMVVALVWAVLGTRMARAIAFPLGFLFFSVPFGEFLFPSMMERTADFIIFGLRLSGVPVYAEGMNLVVPSGSWAVVEGCSGVRYLIASVVVGSLYAYLTYTSITRRIIFIVLSAVVPVFANWLRAYGIVMLGHLSDNRLAAGVDHLVYGWVFFGIVMLALFWIGARWREDDLPVSGSTSAGMWPKHAAREPKSAVGMSKAAAFGMLAGLVVSLSWKPVLGVLNEQGEHGPVMFGSVQAQAQWQSDGKSGLPEWAPRYSGMRAELKSSWISEAGPVGLYMAYYRDQGPEAELVSSENRVLLNKDPLWTVAVSGSGDASIGSHSSSVRSTEIYNATDRLLVWHVFWIGGRWTTSDHIAKIYLALSRLAGKGDDSAVVMVYAPIQDRDRGRAEATLGKFLRDMGPSVEASLAAATGG